MPDAVALREAGQQLMAEAARLRQRLEAGRAIARGVADAWIGPAETAFVTELPERERALMAAIDAIERAASELIARADVAAAPD